MMPAATEFTADSFLSALRHLYVRRYREEVSSFYASERMGVHLNPNWLTEPGRLANWIGEFSNARKELAQSDYSDLPRVDEVDTRADNFYKQAAEDVKKILHHSELAKVGRAVVGEIPLVKVNATVFSLPSTDHVVAVNRALNDMLLQYNSIFLKFLLEVERDIQAGCASDAAWDFLVDVQAGKINPYDWIKENTTEDFFHRRFFPLWFIQTCFIIAHEFGHIICGHLEDGAVHKIELHMKEGSRRTVEMHTENRQQERDADIFAWNLMQRMFGAGELWKWCKVAVSNLFVYFEYIERVECISAHVGRVLAAEPAEVPVDFRDVSFQYESETHPKARERREFLRARFGEFTSSEESLVEAGELSMIGFWDAFVEDQQRRGWLTGVTSRGDGEWAVRRNQAEQYIDSGMQCLEDGDLESAIVAYKKAIELNPYHPTAFGILGKLLIVEDTPLGMVYLERSRLLRDAYELLGTTNASDELIENAMTLIKHKNL